LIAPNPWRRPCVKTTELLEAVVIITDSPTFQSKLIDPELEEDPVTLRIEDTVV
jgi:hypothetical protein